MKQYVKKKFYDGLQGYDLITDNNGEIKWFQHSTGEIVDGRVIFVPEGSKLYTPESQEAYENFKQQEAKRKMRRQQKTDLGNSYYFVCRDEKFIDLKPAIVARLIYLATFLAIDSNKLMLNRNTPMKRKNLTAVLHVAKSTVSVLMKEASAYIVEDKNGELSFADNSVFVRGHINQKRKFRKSYQRFFISGVRTLYESTTNHKHLGYVFKLLSFINIEYNVLCFNSLETEKDKIEAMSIAEFCNMIGLDISHLGRLMRIYSNLQFKVNNKLERFCSFVSENFDRTNSKMYINPHILYSGSDYKKVELLGGFCQD